MRTRPSRKLPVVVLLLVAVGACTQAPPAQPDRTVSRPAPFGTVPSDPPPPSTPPAVERPLDAGAYRSRLCDILTNEQAAALGFPGTPFQRGSSTFLVCSRESKEPPLNLYVAYSGSDLFTKVLKRTAFPTDYIKSVRVSGQPAIEQGSADLSGQVKYCTIVFGLSTTEAMQVDVQDKNGSGACERATKVAEAIVHNLGG